MAKKANGIKKYKNLPPHTYEAHPLTTAGEVNRPFLIGIITVIAIILVLLILFIGQKQFIGQAIHFTAEQIAQEGWAGIAVTGDKISFDSVGDTGTATVSINTEGVYAVDFVLDYDPASLEITCPNTELLGKIFADKKLELFSKVDCNTAGKIIVQYVGLPVDNYKIGDNELLSLSMKAKKEGTSSISFSKFEVYSPSQDTPVKINTKMTSIVVGKILKGVGEGCTTDLDCLSGVCDLTNTPFKCIEKKDGTGAPGTGSTLKKLGDVCANDNECETNRCYSAKCVLPLGRLDDICKVDADCQTNACDLTTLKCVLTKTDAGAGGAGGTGASGTGVPAAFVIKAEEVNQLTTKITSGKDIIAPFWVFTQYKDKDGNILLLKKEMITSMKDGISYVSEVSYNDPAKISEKSVVIYDNDKIDKATVKLDKPYKLTYAEIN
jgi:hypothetical protein